MMAPTIQPPFPVPRGFGLRSYVVIEMPPLFVCFDSVNAGSALPFLHGTYAFSGSGTFKKIIVNSG
jgi:hypothetical protein